VPEGQAGTATILFTDLVGSTELRARLGDVVVDQMESAHVELLTAAIVEHAGAVVKSLGDGILASFGGAADAVAAGMAIQQAVDRANRRVDDARRLEVRIGLSAGDVSWAAGDVHGTPVVTAARLCDRADGGQVLCDDLVRGLARGRSDATFRLVGELELKGLVDPVVGYDIPWEPMAVGRAPLPAPLLSVAGELPFAGRDDEREALHLQWKSAHTDGRTVVLVSGEPGVGKTRLSAELARAAHDDGAWVLVGRCDENLAAPFAPWIELLRFAVAHAPAELLTNHVERRGGELTRIVPELVRRIGDVPAPRSVDPETERLALFDATADLLDALAIEAPVVLLLDDAHWADGTSLDLLRHVVRHLPPQSQVLIMVTYRDTDLDRTHPLADMIGHFRREPRVERIALHGIDEEGVRDLLTKAGGHELPEDGLALARALTQETEGNPFFIGEILRHLIETGVLVQRDGRWEGTTSVEEAGIPEGIKDVVGRRLSRLSDGANETLRTAAVIGRDFSLDLLAEVIELPEDTVLDHVEEAIGALRLVEEVSGAPGRMTFAHALVRSALIDELSTTRRVRLHRRIGDSLERRPGASAAELAHHFAEAATAGAADKAVLHARRAAEEAFDRLAYDEAVHFYDLALEALETLDDDPSGRSVLLAARGFAQHLRGDATAGRADALAAADAAREVGDAALLAAAGIAYQGWVGQWAVVADPVAVELMREGLGDIAPDDLVPRARTMAALAQALIVNPGDEALMLAEQAAGVARDAADDEALGTALAAWTWALRARGRGAELCRVATLGLEHAEATHRLDRELVPHYNLGAGLVTLGRLEEARHEIDRAASVPSTLVGWASATFGATLALADGRLEEAAQLTDRAHAVAGSLGDTGEVVHCVQHVRIELARGDLDEAMAWAERAESTAWGFILPWTIAVRAERGDPDAPAAFDRFEIDNLPFVPVVVSEQLVETRARIVTVIGGAERAAPVRTDAEKYAGELLGCDTFLSGAAERSIGNMLLVEGRPDEAVGLLDHALAVVETHGFRALVVEHQVELARALLARAGAGDTDRAARLLSEAAEAAGKLGLVAAGRDARSLLDG
jgi:class 3 adenylate cyclase/tetratricopeptide (TPR) repeat protein/type II secretory pathway predicted ATPase ExeA